MDRKSIIVIAVCFGLLLLWYPLVNKIYPPSPVPPGATNGVAAPLTNGTVAPTPAAPPTAVTTPIGTPKPAVTSDAPEQLLVITNENARYTFTSHGGGLKQVELLHYLEDTSRRSDTNRFVTLNDGAVLPTLALLNGEAVQGDGVFELTPTFDGVRAEKTLPNGLRITKEFALSTNYLIAASVRLHNRSNQSLALPAQEWVIGTATALNEDEDRTAVGVMWYNGSKTEDIGEGWFANRTLGCFPGVPRVEFRGGISNVAWAATHNQFFTLAAIPQDPALQIVARKVELPRPERTADQPAPRNASGPRAGYTGAFVYPALTLAPNESMERQVFLFAGPKEYQTLARIAARFDNNVDSVMSFGWFGFFSKALLLSMNWLHNVFSLSYGWAIIVITFIIKMLFWPLTAASTRSMKRMAALQPQMKAIADKYKDDPLKRNQKTMEFMKQNKVNPMGGCLPMLLQMPVFIGFFYMIRSAIELRGASFMWVADLSRPDTLFVIPGIEFPFNLLPLIMGATMLWQAHLTPPSPGMDPMQQKILRYMPLMFVVFLYNFSAGLTLYWTVQNLLTIAQTKLTKTVPPAAAAPAAPSAPVKGQPKPVLTPQKKKRK